MIKISAAVTTSLLAMLSSANAQTDVAAPVANAGTLICTLAPADEAPSGARTEAAVSCRFNAISGAGFDLQGRIVRLSTGDARKTKVVVAWSVVGPSPDISPTDMSGRYTGTLAGDEARRADNDPSAPRGTLFGSNDSGIELHPVDGAGREIVPDAGLTILELEVSAVKV